MEHITSMRHIWFIRRILHSKYLPDREPKTLCVSGQQIPCSKFPFSLTIAVIPFPSLDAAVGADSETRCNHKQKTVTCLGLVGCGLLSCLLRDAPTFRPFVNGKSFGYCARWDEGLLYGTGRRSCSHC